jgi:hypothetical protein
MNFAELKRPGRVLEGAHPAGLLVSSSSNTCWPSRTPTKADGVWAIFGVMGLPRAAMNHKRRL